MSNGIDEEEDLDVEELDGELDDEDFGADDDLGFDEDDDYEEEGGFRNNRNDAGLIESRYEEAVLANPKRLTVAQRKKARSIIEGIIDDAELSEPDGQKKAWDKLNEKIGVAHARAYDIKAEFTENDVIEHPRFGTGFVVELVSPKKIEVLFEDGLRKLACNIG